MNYIDNIAELIKLTVLRVNKIKKYFNYYFCNLNKAKPAQTTLMDKNAIILYVLFKFFVPIFNAI